MDLELRGAIGYVARARGRRRYTEEQVLLLQRIARYRSTLGIPLAEAGALAAETCGGPPVLEAQRLVHLMENAMSGSEERARTAREISEALLLRAGILARAA